MSYMAVGDNSITIAKGLLIDHYSGSIHTLVDVELRDKPATNDAVSDVVVSADGKYLALITSVSKQLLVYDLPLTENCKRFVLPRSASKVRFTANNHQILVADKSGDALIYNIKEGDAGTKLLGHLSLLLDILQTNDEKYIITSDRDEKIKVSSYPNTYNIQTYCLGHKEFVNHLELLPHNDKYLTSTSGDGHVKCWTYADGCLHYSIDTYLDVNDAQLKENFTNFMDTEGVEVNTLPIVHYAVAQINENSSIVAVVVHSFNKLLLYNLKTVDNQFSHTVIDKLTMDRLPAAVKLHNSNLYVYDDVDSNVSIFKVITVGGNVSLQFDKKIRMFENKSFNANVKENSHDSIKVLYKRKFDNVQEYQERKKQRLEKLSQ